MSDEGSTKVGPLALKRFFSAGVMGNQSHEFNHWEASEATHIEASSGCVSSTGTSVTTLGTGDKGNTVDLAPGRRRQD